MLASACRRLIRRPCASDRPRFLETEFQGGSPRRLTDHRSNAATSGVPQLEAKTLAGRDHTTVERTNSSRAAMQLRGRRRARCAPGEALAAGDQQRRQAAVAARRGPVVGSREQAPSTARQPSLTSVIVADLGLDDRDRARSK